MRIREAVNVLEKYTMSPICPAVIEAHKMAIDALEKEQMRQRTRRFPEWHHVRSREDLPEADKDVFLALLDGTFDTGYFDEAEGWFFDRYGENVHEISFVVAWAEFPEHPLYG